MFNLTVYVKSVLQLLAIAIIVWFLYTVRGLIVYVSIAALLALITKPLVNFLSSRKIGKLYIPRGLNAALVLILLIFIFSLISTLMVPKLIAEFAVLSKIDFGNVYQTALDKISIFSSWLNQQNIELNNLENSIRQNIGSFFSIQTIEGTVGSILGGLGNMAIAFFSIIFILFFFLKEKFLAQTILNDYLPNKLSDHLEHIIPKIKKTLFRYFIGLLIQMTGIFLIVYIGLSIMGVESAIVIAVFAAFINLIPYVGPGIGAIFGLVLGLGQAIAIDPEISIGLLALKIVIVFAITQLTDNFVYQPLIFSNSINAHPLEIFIVISIAGLMGGILGMVVAVPTYSMLRIVSKEFFTKSKFIQSMTKNV